MYELQYDNILDDFKFEPSRTKVKVKVAIFFQNVSAFYRLYLWIEFLFNNILFKFKFQSSGYF